jgi:hypothetical protein
MKYDEIRLKYDVRLFNIKKNLKHNLPKEKKIIGEGLWVL